MQVTDNKINTSDADDRVQRMCQINRSRRTDSLKICVLNNCTLEIIKKPNPFIIHS